MRVDEQRRYYDRRWTEAVDDELDSHQRARLLAIERVLASARRRRPPPWRVLEVGCGTGWLSAALSRYGSVAAVDLSEAAVTLARDRYPGIGFEARDVLDAPLEPVHDLVVASEVIEHVEDQDRFVDVLAESTAPGGHLVLTTPNGRVADRWQRRPDWRPQPIENWVAPDELRRFLARRFGVARVTTFFFDFDRRGVYRFLNHPRYSSLVAASPAAALADRACGRLGLGLYTVALARRRLSP